MGIGEGVPRVKKVVSDGGKVGVSNMGFEKAKEIERVKLDEVLNCIMLAGVVETTYIPTSHFCVTHVHGLGEGRNSLSGLRGQESQLGEEED